MSATIEYIEDVEQANYLLNKCLNTIDELNNRVDEEKARTQKYRETNTKLRKSNIDLRDYIAAKAMPLAFKVWENYHLSDENDATYKTSNFQADGNYQELIAKTAYQMADAMMEARK